MALERRSLQDLIRGRQQSGFVARRGRVIQYRENLAYRVDDERRKFLFNIHGDAGVGKTYLTQRFQEAAGGSGALTAYVDETSDDVIAVMNAVAEQLRRAGVSMSGYQNRADYYRERRRELESDPSAPAGLATFLTKTAVTTELHPAQLVPIGDSVLAPVDPMAATEQIDRARIYTIRKVRSSADMRLLLSPVDELTRVFVADLNRIAPGRLITLFFDSFDRTSSFLGRWLLDLYVGLYGGLPANLTTTITGRHSLDPNFWDNYLPVIEDIPLERFSEAEARQFLASKNITDEPTIGVILTLSERLPVWLATLADARPEETVNIGDPAGNAAERFLRWENDPDRRAVAAAAALPRRLSQGMLSALPGPGNRLGLFDWLCARPFVAQQADSWVYHEVVRAAMLRLQRNQSPRDWRDNHIALAAANARLAAGTAGDSDGGWSDPRWVAYTREQAYHLLCADPRGNRPRALALAVKAAEADPAHARQCGEILTDAGRDADQADLWEWGQRLLDGIQGTDLTGYFSCLISYADLEPVILRVALEERAAQHARAGRYEDAVADYDRIIDLDPGILLAFRARSRAYALMRRYREALADFNRVIELSPDNSWTISDRGIIFRLMGRYPEALADFNRAIELDPYNAWAIGGRGQVRQEMRQYSEALTDFSRAIELDPYNAWAIGGRGQTYQLMRWYEEALADYNRAIELDPNWASAIGDRGHTYRLMGRYADALADFNRAIELDPDNAGTIDGRGIIFRLTGRYAEALADFNRAVELDPGYSGAIGGRGQTHWLMGRAWEALADFNRAIELDPLYAWAIGSRGQLHQAEGRYQEALADFNRAVELNPSNALAIGRRGQLYQAATQYERALADFDRAIELDPGYAGAIGSRGEVYRAEGRYQEALADFDRAIELDPDNAAMIGGRGQVYQLTGRHEEALADFGRAIELDPDSPAAIGSRGITYGLMGRYADALADFGRAIELNPNLAGAFGSRGIIFRLMGRYADALADFSRAIELNPHDAGAIRSRGQTYRLMGQAWEALGDFNRAIELNPDDAVAIGSRGQIHQAEGRYQDALADFDRAIELNPNLAGAISGRGIIFRLMGRFDEALADFNRAIELSPDEARALGNRGEPSGARGRPEPPRGRGNGADPGTTP